MIEGLDLAILALRIALILALYLFLVAVLRVARTMLVRADSGPAGGRRASPSRVPEPRQGVLRLTVLAAGDSALTPGEAIETQDGTVLGRGGRSRIRLADPTVSTEHALLNRGPAGWVVRDLGSTNGTYLNGVRVEDEARLVPGDLLALGGVQVRVDSTA